MAFNFPTERLSPMYIKDDEESVLKERYTIMITLSGMAWKKALEVGMEYCLDVYADIISVAEYVGNDGRDMCQVVVTTKIDVDNIRDRSICSKHLVDKDDFCAILAKGVEKFLGLNVYSISIGKIGYFSENLEATVEVFTKEDEA